MQSTSTFIAGMIIGLIFQWKLALVAIACLPVLISSGYIRLCVFVLKDERNKAAHAFSAQLACEAAGSILTIASLTGKRIFFDCTARVSRSL